MVENGLLHDAPIPTVETMGYKMDRAYGTLRVFKQCLYFNCLPIIYSQQTQSAVGMAHIVATGFNQLTLYGECCILQVL